MGKVRVYIIENTLFEDFVKIQDNVQVKFQVQVHVHVQIQVQVEIKVQV